MIEGTSSVRRAGPWVFLAITLFGGIGCAGGPDRGVLRVGSDLSNPPFASLDGRGEPTGLEVAMMRALARELGLELRWDRMEFSELLDAVALQKIDVACATIGVTPDRARFVEFSTPYYDTAIAVVTRKGLIEPNSITDLQTGRVAAAKGTTSEAAVRTRIPGAEGVFEVEAESSVAERLLAGEIDAAVMDEPNARSMVGEYPGLRILPEPLAEERYALALRKGNHQLLERVNAALRRLRLAGALPTEEKVSAEAGGGGAG